RGHCVSARGGGEANALPLALSTLGVLLQLLHLVNAPRGRSIGVGTATEGERRATEPGLFRPARSTGGRSFGEPLGTARRARAPSRARDAGAPDCPHAGGGSQRGEP